MNILQEIHKVMPYYMQEVLNKLVLFDAILIINNMHLVLCIISSKFDDYRANGKLPVSSSDLWKEMRTNCYFTQQYITLFKSYT